MILFKKIVHGNCIKILLVIHLYWYTIVSKNKFILDIRSFYGSLIAFFGLKKMRESRLTVTFPRNPSWGVRIVLYLHYVSLSQLKRKIDFKVRPIVMLIF